MGSRAARKCASLPAGPRRDGNNIGVRMRDLVGVRLADGVTKAQQKVCARLGVQPVSAALGLKVGISRSVRDGVMPLNGLRHPPEEGTSGWFIWAGGELSDDPDFFVPLHVGHLDDWCLRSCPTWRFHPGGASFWPLATRMSGTIPRCLFHS